MSVFECVHLRSNLFRRIGRQNGAFCLKDNRPFVVMFVYVMDRNTGLPFAGGNDRLVHVYPVHAFASVFRQKCRMNIDNLTRIGIQQGIGDLIHEAGKDNQIRIIFRKLCQDRRPICKFLPRKDKRRNTQLIHPGMHTNVPVVRQNNCHLNSFTFREISDDILRVRTRSGSKNCYVFHVFSFFCAQEKKKCAVFRIFSSLNLFCNIKNSFLCTANLKSIFVFINLN